MSNTAKLNVQTVHFEPPNEGGEDSGSALEQSLQDDNDYSGDRGTVPVSENSESSSINSAATSLSDSKESDQFAAAKGKESGETIENLVALFRDFLEAAPNPATPNSTYTRRSTTGRKRFFGLNKGLSPEAGSNNRYDYEQKYPRDRPGEEVADNARVWLTYLDEAESFDRERVDGWKETADVLLVFAGLFSGVITTFISQSSQSLQQDNTQVSASLLFEITQLLRAQSNGTPINIIPNSALTPTSAFTPSTNALLVNALWFSSLVITVSTALFAVLAKQWLYYYLSSITGTAHEKVRARQLRFKGFELWKVGAIVELLPILLHIAVGKFLVGIILLLFPLDARIAWTLVGITGTTYVLYFISVLLPIQYPECPYTTSLTIYIGVLVFSLRRILRWISSRTLEKGLQAIWRRVNFEAQRTIRRLLYYTQALFLCALFCTWRFMSRGFRKFRPTIFADGFPKFTNWREDNIKKAIKNVASLDYEALDWLYATSPNTNVHRIIARYVAVHPVIGLRFNQDFTRKNIWQTLEISETNVVDLRYGLCLDLLTHARKHWRLLRSIHYVEESQLEETEHRSYSLIVENVLGHNYDQILKGEINLRLPLVMWCYFFGRVSGDAAIAVHILDSGQCGLFTWKPDPTCEIIHNAGIVSFDGEELGWWKFGYLYRYFFDDPKPDYSLDKTFKIRYLLLVSVYRNLTSDRPLVAVKERRQKSLYFLFFNFWNWVDSEHVSSEQSLTFFIDICSVDAFWSESMTDDGRKAAVRCLGKIWNSLDPDVANRFLSTEFHDLSLIYQWCSRNLHSDFSRDTTPIFALLFMPHNRTRLCTILLNDPKAVSHLSQCFQNSRNVWGSYSDSMYRNLMDLLKSVNPKVSLFTILYNSSVLVQVWKFLVFHKVDAKKFFLDVKSKLDREKLDELYTAMNKQAQSNEDKLDDDADASDSDSDIDTEPDPLQASADASDLRTDIDPHPNPLQASAHEFGHIIGVSRPQLKSTNEQSAPECAADKDHDAEERAQVPNANERKGFHSIANWAKKVFKPVWPKTSVE